MAKGSDPVTVLHGVGPARQKQLAALHIETLEDLICHFPRGYEDRTALLTIDRLQVDQPACFRATVMSTPRTAHVRKGLDITKVTVADHTARLNLTFFNRKFGVEQLQYGREYYFYGAVSGDFIGYNMTSPEFEPAQSRPECTRRVLPLYPLTAGLTNRVMARLVEQAMAICPPPEEILPEPVLQEYGLLPAETAYRAIHSPDSAEQAQQAKRRMIFEEFFVFSAGLALMRAVRAEKHVAPWEKLELEPFFRALPFSLTGAQSRAIEEIRKDFRRGSPMNRLLQGDVGSGKTMVAAAAAYLAWQNGFQTALMAPTEILAEQHARGLERLLGPLGVRVGLLTGSMGAPQARQARQAAADGQVDLLVGTHALLTGTTAFARLGLVIADEQHRFGVEQRAALARKGDDPHLLVMSATPIPRTLALLMYGDLELSVLDELPPGRERVDTFLVGESYRPRIHAFIRKQVEQGHQCYVVCPAVEENQELDIKSAQTWAQTLGQTVFPDLRVSVLHGRMPARDKQQTMEAFARGEADVLVATTVVEVGVDVPNATLMVIEDADRFGLSQLHQLRGRVGRGKAKSYCILTTHNRSPDTLRRLKALCATDDGFAIAQEDLKLRGPGDFFGSRQSGLPVFRIASQGNDLELLAQAQKASAQWIGREDWQDTPRARALRGRMEALFRRGGGVMN